MKITQIIFLSLILSACGTPDEKITLSEGLWHFRIDEIDFSIAGDTSPSLSFRIKNNNRFYKVDTFTLRADCYNGSTKIKSYYNGDEYRIYHGDLEEKWHRWNLPYFYNVNKIILRIETVDGVVCDPDIRDCQVKIVCLGENCS